VLDLTSWWVGAAATQTLAHLGAEVVHIESTSHPDGMRLTGPAFDQPDWWERGYMFLAANTNKRGLTLELDTPEGHRLLDDLIARADVLVENFAPRVAERWGLGPAQVQATNPMVVYVRMPAFGLTGPWRERAAFAQTIEPMSGMAHITGYPDDLPLAKGGLADAVAGQHGAWATLVGLAERHRRGVGVFVEATMVEAALNVTAQPVLEHSAYGATMTRMGNRSPHAAPQGVYPCAGSDSWIAVSVCDDDQWEGLVAALGDRRLTDAGLDSHERRVQHHDRLDTILSEWSAVRDQVEAVAELVAHGVPAGACRDPRTAGEHPQLIARGFFEIVEHPVTGCQALPGAPYRFRSVNRWIRTPAPTLGQDNERVLSELVSSAEELLDLSSREIIGTRPKGL
jgi:crotonobetainyl-CoA:carnitine CoA-transferase CaiB-like acyl-CoA transferase